MNTEQFTYFIEAAESLNFSSVAKLHYVTPPVITRQIKMLEDEIGVNLFIRNGHKLMLTEEGKVFLKYAKSIYSLTNEGIQHAQKLKAEKLGTLHIAGVASSSKDSQNCIALLEHRCLTRLLGNILWFVFGGVISGLAWILSGYWSMSLC